MSTARFRDRIRWHFCFLVVLILSASVAEAQEATLNELHQLGRQAFGGGEYAEASRYFRLALQRAETGAASDSDLVMSLADLAEVLRSTRQYDEAERLFNRALQILQKNPTADQATLAVILGNQGRLYAETRRYALSEVCLKKALRLTEINLGPRHAQMVQVLNSLGNLYASTGRWKNAETALKKAAAVAEQLSLPRVYASSLGNLATFYERRRQWTRAIPLHLRALSLAEESYGVDHPETGIILSNLGLAYYRQGKIDEAEAVLRRALEVRRKIFGASDTNTAMSSFGLGLVLTAEGKYDEAKLMYTESLRILEMNTVRTGPDVVMILEEFAILLRKMESVEEASVMEARAKYIRAESAYTVRLKTGGQR